MNQYRKAPQAPRGFAKKNAVSLLDAAVANLQQSVAILNALLAEVAA